MTTRTRADVIRRLREIRTLIETGQHRNDVLDDMDDLIYELRKGYHNARDD